MYAKIFRQMYDGTLVLNNNWHALVTFQQMLILADAEGVVDIPPAIIARTTGIPVEIIKDGIKQLEKPDNDSRTPTDDGRRIQRLDDHRDWGWQITNFAHYRDLVDNEARREYFRNYKRDYRKNKKLGDVSTVDKLDGPRQSKKSRTSTHVDVDVNEDGKKTPSAPNAIAFDADAGAITGIQIAQRQRWTAAYPAIDVDVEIARATEWLVANPKNRKSDYRKFLTNWFSRAQDRAPGRGGASKRERDFI